MSTTNSNFNDTINVWVVIEVDEVMGVYDNEEDAERACNSYFDAEVTGPWIMEITSNES